eukprot:8070-Heterococcus_DN1.PRE.3
MPAEPCKEGRLCSYQITFRLLASAFPDQSATAGCFLAVVAVVVCCCITASDCSRFQAAQALARRQAA